MAPGSKYSVKMTDEQMEGFKQTFMMFDKVIMTSKKSLLCNDFLNKDGDGTVSTKELGAVLRSLG